MKILMNEDAKKYTTMKVGGIIDKILIPSSIDELKEAITENSFILGNGSNIIVSDKGIRNPVIKLTEACSNIKIDGNIVTVGAGVMLPSLCKLVAKAGLSGLEFACGIPGTIGGAIYMNVGAFTGVICDVVESVKAIDRQGNESMVTDCNFSHRSSCFHKNNLVIIEVTFKLIYGEVEKIKALMRLYTRKRKATQPIDFPNSGSIFKTKKARKRIKEAELSGHRIGGAEISAKNTGFIINKGKATFKDVSELIRYVQVTVENKLKKKLYLEVEKVGQGARRAAIITLIGYYNYGQRLQNYATTKILENMGYEVETLCFKKIKKSNACLEKFNSDYMKLKYIPALKGLNTVYDLVVVGSDQVFNPYYLKRRLKKKVNLISIAKKISKNKLISLSASFGISDMPEESKQMFTKHLLRYSHLSVREQAGADIVKELTGIEAKVLLDPVMLLDEWDDLATKIAPDNGYIFNFFVDRKVMHPKYVDEIIQLAVDNKLEVRHAYQMTVGSFLGTIKHARLIVTNSFHVVLFSIIFRKPFVLLEDRDIMTSRFDTLFDKFPFGDRKITKVEDLNKIPIDMDYSIVADILKQEREKAYEFIKKAGGIKQ